MAEVPEVTILLLGDADCGKSTFLSRISQGSLSSNTSAPASSTQRPPALTTLRDSNQPFVFDITFFARPYRFKFYDTASPESWTLLRPNVVVLCYDISSRLSLINVQRLWRPQTTLHHTSRTEIPVLLLGLKRDLRSETDPNGIIYPQEGYCIAQEMRCDRYLECSAVTGELVKEVFEDICRTAAKGANKEGGGLSEGGCAIM